MSSAEEGLMALLEAMLTLAARDVRRPKPLVKPGGHPEEQFLDLTEDERDEFSCNICYQVLKETMHCVNNHKFCHSCLLVWSTTGQYANRIRCPVCRTHGYYFRNSEVDERIGAKKVKCLIESCSWTGLLKYFASHRHTTYGGSNNGSEDNSTVTTMPRLAQATPHINLINTRFTGTGLSTHGNSDVNVTMSPRFALFGSNTLTPESSSSQSSTSQETVIELPRRLNVPPNTRFNNRIPLRRTPNTTRAASYNRITFSHTGPNTDSSNNVEDESPPLSERSTQGDVTESTTVSVGSGHTPRPPSGPRTASSTVNQRRLPRIVNPPPQRHRYQPPEAMSLNDGGRPRPSENLGEIRDRLQESRSRLDNLMTSFSGELDRSRQEMAHFQQERERQRREQLEEVRELGQRLGQVASELRRLLEHRRFISSLSDEDEDDIE